MGRMSDKMDFMERRPMVVVVLVVFVVLNAISSG